MSKASASAPVRGAQGDPRSMVTPDAFVVSDALLGMPLAAPGRRLVAILVDLLVIGILTAVQREVVIDRLFALDADDIDIEQVKWVVLMVLFSQPGQENAYERMEDLVFEERRAAMH